MENINIATVDARISRYPFGRARVQPRPQPVQQCNSNSVTYYNIIGWNDETFETKPDYDDLVPDDFGSL